MGLYCCLCWRPPSLAGTRRVHIRDWRACAGTGGHRRPLLASHCWGSMSHAWTKLPQIRDRCCQFRRVLNPRHLGRGSASPIDSIRLIGSASGRDGLCPALTASGSTACTPRAGFTSCVMRRSTAMLASANTSLRPIASSRSIRSSMELSAAIAASSRHRVFARSARRVTGRSQRTAPSPIARDEAPRAPRLALEATRSRGRKWSGSSCRRARSGCPSRATRGGRSEPSSPGDGVASGPRTSGRGSQVPWSSGWPACSTRRP